DRLETVCPDAPQRWRPTALRLCLCELSSNSLPLEVYLNVRICVTGPQKYPGSPVVCYSPPRPPKVGAAVGAGGRNLGSRIRVISSLAASRCARVSWSVDLARAAAIDVFKVRSSARYIGFSSPLAAAPPRPPRPPGACPPGAGVVAAEIGGLSLLLTKV